MLKSSSMINEITVLLEMKSFTSYLYIVDPLTGANRTPSRVQLKACVVVYHWPLEYSAV